MSIIKRVKPILISLIFLLFLISIYSLADSGDVNLESVNGNRNVIDIIKGKHRDTESIRAVVHQIKQLVTLKEPVNVEGTIIVRKPSMLRWETYAPERSITVIDGKTVTMYYPIAKEAEIYKLTDNLIASNTISFFKSIMWGALDDMEKRFALNVFEDIDEFIIELVPHSKMISKHLSSIMIYYDKQTGMPKEFVVKTPNGSKTITRIEDIEINPKISADTFKLNLMPDVVVRDHSITQDFN